MKAAGITWWRANYGSILQAYALQEYLNNEKKIDYEILCQYGKKIYSFTNLIDKIYNIGFVKTIKRAFCKLFLRKLRLRNKSMQNFVNSKLKISIREYNQKNIFEANKIYDAFFCGSDQIWNPTLTDLKSIYWLNFASSDKLKIAYAPSIGVSYLDDEQARIIQSNLKDFKGISCREADGTNLINSIIKNKKCINVLDPTLLVEKNVWDKLLENNDNKYGEYIFVYLLRGNKKERKFIEEFSKEKKLKIITMPFLEPEHLKLYDLKFGNIKIWDADPVDFIKLIKNARYVFTDSYHCSIFSTIYHKTFYLFPKEGKAQMSRLENFQKMIGLTDRIIYSYEDFDFNKKIEWNDIDKKIEVNRKISRKFIDDSLKS